MLRLKYSRQFLKDYKKANRRGLDLDQLHKFIKLLEAGADLPARSRPHKLSGKFAGTWECHVAPDWLLIYEYSEDELVLRRTGTHSDLFR